MSLLPFWALNVLVTLLSMQGQKALGFHQKYLNLSFEDERRSYGFGTTWRLAINDRIFVFGWTIPLRNWPESLFKNMFWSSVRRETNFHTQLYLVVDFDYYYYTIIILHIMFFLTIMLLIINVKIIIKNNRPTTFTFSYLADAFIQSDLQMRKIEAIKTNKRATICKRNDKSQLA